MNCSDLEEFLSRNDPEALRREKISVFRHWFRVKNQIVSLQKHFKLRFWEEETRICLFTKK